MGQDGSNPDANVIYQDDIVTVRGKTIPFVVGSDRKTSLQGSMSPAVTVVVGTTMNVAARITRSDITSDGLVPAQSLVTLTIVP